MDEKEKESNFFRDVSPYYKKIIEERAKRERESENKKRREKIKVVPPGKKD
ncbi:hypothetical protein [Desulforhabdus sp. TSK]|uniref:hypothetical protein n=1 Tax=Desulforhabdus sp. TSK TaxID=2925014 RepID=UPI001FC859D4|nr:hypothetical protein [Desulforhabdus sp. TSK]GKT09128.1 hypothetical protein DSTSK_24330 [Desulforhabdus sp. TSK]